MYSWHIYIYICVCMCVNIIHAYVYIYRLYIYIYIYIYIIYVYIIYIYKICRHKMSIMFNEIWIRLFIHSSTNLTELVHEEIGIFLGFIYLFCSYIRVCFQLAAFVREHTWVLNNETWTHSCLQFQWFSVSFGFIWRSLLSFSYSVFILPCFTFHWSSSSSLIEYPINKALCHICFWRKQQAGNIHVCKNKINK